MTECASWRTDKPPTSQLPTRPESLPPYSRSTTWPVLLKPMRREKNGRPFCASVLSPGIDDWRWPPMPPNSKMSASRKKKSRFSGKKSPRRVRLTCRSSTSVTEKSVLIVREPFNCGVMRYAMSSDGFVSEPDSPVRKFLRSLTASDGTISSPMPCCSPSNPTASPETAGLYARLRDTQALTSFLRTTVREKLSPHVSVVGSNEIDLYGISISAVQPPSKRRGGRVEDRIPVAVELRDVAIEAVGAHAVRVQAEEVAAAPIVERIDRDVEAVVLAEVVVLAHVARRDLRRVRVVEPRRDVERVVVEENQDLGALVGHRVLDRRDLVQIVDDRPRWPTPRRSSRRR